MFDKQLVWLIVIVAVVCLVLGGFFVHSIERPVVQQVTQGVQHSDTVTIAGKTVHDTVTKHTTAIVYQIDTVYNSIATHTDTVFKLDSSYAYGFHLSYPDSAKIASTVIIHGLPKIPDSDIKNTIVYTPAPVRTITNTRTDTMKTVQKQLTAFVVGIQAGLDTQKKLYAGLGFTWGIRIY